MNYAVTTFSKQGWQEYGKRFVDSFLQHWPVPLVVFGEGQSAPDGYRGMRELMWFDLKDDPEHEEFVSKYSGPEFNDPLDYSMSSVKFCHKVFAVTSPKLPQEGWRVWIDSDVVTTRSVEPQHIAALFPHGKSLTFLGRVGEMRPGQPMHTECGFVGYNQAHSDVLPMLARMREVYTSGELFTLGRHNWHDSYVFDYCRIGGTDEGSWNNLSAHIRERQLHVWPDTILSEIMVHNKGAARKMAAYTRAEGS